MEFSSRIKLVVVGDGNVGKTCMLISYTTNSFPAEGAAPTVFDDFLITVEVEGKPVAVVLFDSAGGADFDWPSMVYPGTDVFLVCFSVVNRESFGHVITKWLPKVREKGNGAKILLVGCKQDLRTEVDDTQQVSIAEVEQLSIKESIPFLECSALTHYNVKDVFGAAITAVLFPEKRKQGLLNWFKK